MLLADGAKRNKKTGLPVAGQTCFYPVEIIAAQFYDFGKSQ